MRWIAADKQISPIFYNIKHETGSVHIATCTTNCVAFDSVFALQRSSTQLFEGVCVFGFLLCVCVHVNWIVKLSVFCCWMRVFVLKVCLIPYLIAIICRETKKLLKVLSELNASFFHIKLISNWLPLYSRYALG